MDANCGNQATLLTLLPADLMVVLDRSGSMTTDIASETLCDPPTPSCTQRWSAMLAGMQKVLASSPTSIDWGLKFVLFTGATCDRIKAGVYENVQVLFGCPGATTVPSVIP